MARVRRVRPQGPRLPTGAILSYKRLLFAALDEAQAQIEKLLVAPAEKKLEREAEKRTDARTDLKVRAAEIDLVFAQIDRTAAAETKRLVGISGIVSPKLQARFRKENVSLITSISEDQLDQVTDLLDESFERGDDVRTLRKNIQERFDVAKSRADLIARDQVLKMNSQITQSRQKSAGITHYVWSTSQDERVREMHADLEGETFAWDDPPITNEQDETNHPGEDYQCRCVAIPVLPSDDDDA